MTLRDRLKKEIPRSWFIGIVVGGICGIAIVGILAGYSLGFGTAQCGLPPADIMVMKLGPDGLYPAQFWSHKNQRILWS